MERAGEADRVRAIFAQALDWDPAQWELLVAAACGSDTALREEVLALLVCDTEAADFLEQPAMARLALGTPGIQRLGPGDTLDRYEIVSFLGAGAVSEVYRAHDTRLGRTVALKVLTDPTAPNAGGWLLREAQFASILNHRCICTVHEVDEVDARPFIVLEHIDGITLHAAMKQGPLPMETIVRWGAEIADALDHAHRHGVVHRDLKGSNVIVTTEQNIKVLDFGLARRLEPGAESNPAQSVLADASVAGTLTHIAPEVLARGPADARVDIWALGVILYEMASGAVPFRGATAFATANAILRESPVPLPPGVPAAYGEIVDRCLSKDPAARFQSAALVRDALASLQRDLAAGSQRPRAGRYAVVATLAASLLVAAGYLANATLGRSARSGPQTAGVMAVLPLRDASGDQAQRFLADGMTEAIIAELGRIDALRVIAPGSTRGFQGQTDAVRAVARETGAAQVLSGALTKIEDRIQLDLRLIEVSSGRVLWSAEYDRHPRELQALYGTVARDVAKATAIDLRNHVADRLTQVRAVDPDVYEAYLKGRYYWNQRTAESLRLAIAQYDTAIRLDPTYAPAYAALADCYNQLGTQMVGGGSPAEWRPKAAEAAIRALQIDAGLAEAHATLGYVRHYDWEWDTAERSFRRAIELNPSYALARIWYANLLSGRSRVDEALAQVTAAAELDPLSSVIGTNVGWVFINARRYDDAISALAPVVRRDPGYVQAHTRLSAAYSFSGRHEQALEEAVTANRLAQNSAATRASLAQALALAGRRADAERLLEELLADRKQHYVPTGAIGNIYTALRREDEALRWLAQSHSERTNNNAYLAVEPVYDVLRAHPRFQALVAATGLP
jgi:serine/threonine-protein kinase